MSYVEQSLSNNEKILYKAQYHWTFTFMAIVLLIVGIGLFMLITKWTTEIVLTNKRIIYKRGWISRKTDEIGLNRIEEINLTQGILGRILGFGKLKIQGTGGGGFTSPNIDSPLQFRREIENSKEEA